MGRVRVDEHCKDNKTTNQSLLAYHLDKKGLSITVKFTWEGRGETFTVKNLVAEAFLPPFGRGEVILRSKDDIYDMSLKNLRRINTGLTNRRKLYYYQMEDIQEARKEGAEIKALAKEYYVSRPVLDDVLRRDPVELRDLTEEENGRLRLDPDRSLHSELQSRSLGRQ